MKTLLLSLALFIVCTCSGGMGPFNHSLQAQSLDAFRWKSRPLILFTPTPNDPVFQEQYRALSDMEEEFSERSIKICFVTPEGARDNAGLFMNASQATWYYDYFGAEPYQFEMVLVGLDGHEKFRATNTITPPSVILGMIDRMPMRRREILRGNGNKSASDHLRTDNSPAAARRY